MSTEEKIESALKSDLKERFSMLEELKKSMRDINAKLEEAMKSFDDLDSEDVRAKM